MITRRDAIIGAMLSAGAWRAGGAAEQGIAGEAEASGLIALPGKRPLIKRTFRPPNYETPLSALREAFTPNDAFFVRYHGAAIAQVDPQTWRLQLQGASAQRSLSLSLDDLKRRFERVSVAAINQCSGNRRGLVSPRVPGVQWGHGAMGNAVWSGVRLRDVLREVGVRADAVEVVFGATDAALLPSTPAFVKSIPIERALDEHTLIAFEMNSAPLPHWNGAPARLVVPGWTATYWIKHLSEIRVEPKAFDGFWMKSGYRLPKGLFPGAPFPGQDNAETQPITEILVNSLITSHRDGERLNRNAPAHLSGWAWDNGQGIAAVEVSADQGRSWRKASLGSDLGRFAWRGFQWRLDTSRPGPIRLWVRARSRSGAIQPKDPIPNPSGYHHNAIQTVSLEIA